MTKTKEIHPPPGIFLRTDDSLLRKENFMIESRTHIKTGRSMRLIAMFLMAALMLCGCKDKPKKQTDPTDAENTPVPVHTGSGEATLSEEAGRIYQFAAPKSGDTIVKINIKKYGTICVKLFPEEAPKAVENFTTLARQGCYDNVRIARVIADYIVQSATAQGYQSSIYGGSFEQETSERLKPARGALCMADTGEEGTVTTCFYFVATKPSTIQGISEPLDARYQMTFQEYLQEAYNTKMSEEDVQFYYTYGGAPWLYGHQTVFGQIYDGFDVLDSICEARVTSKCVPNPGIFIESITVETLQ